MVAYDDFRSLGVVNEFEELWCKPILRVNFLKVNVDGEIVNDLPNYLNGRK